MAIADVIKNFCKPARK